MPGASDEYGTLFGALELTLEQLDEEQPGMARLCTMLGIFPEDAQVPLDVVATLWVAAGGLEDAAEVSS